MAQWVKYLLASLRNHVNTRTDLVVAYNPTNEEVETEDRLKTSRFSVRVIHFKRKMENHQRMYPASVLGVHTSECTHHTHTCTHVHTHT